MEACSINAMPNTLLATIFRNGAEGQGQMGRLGVLAEPTPGEDISKLDPRPC